MDLSERRVCKKVERNCPKGRKKFRRKAKESMSLRMRFLLLFLLNTVLVAGFIGVVSYRDLKKLYMTEVDHSIWKATDSVCTELKAAYVSLEEATMLLTGDTDIREDLEEYLSLLDGTVLKGERQIVEGSMLKERIVSRVSSIVGANQLFGSALCYETTNGNVLIRYSAVTDGNVFTEEEYPVLYHSGKFIVNGIHETVGSGNAWVISASRQLLGKERPVSIYVETRSSFLNGLFRSQRYHKDAFFVMTDSHGNVIYSEDAQKISVGSSISFGPEQKKEKEGKYWYFRSGESGYEIVEVIPEVVYEKEPIPGLDHFAKVVGLSLIVMSGVALFALRSVYRPMEDFRNSCRSIFAQEQRQLYDRQQTAALAMEYTHVPEFDELLDEFYEESRSNLELSKKVQEKEKRQKELELEKLMIQINPHFIHNTLNCVQWVARMHEDKEIEQMVSLFIKILNYNLGKGSAFVTLTEELAAVKNYMELQKIKKNLRVSVTTMIDVGLGNMLIPRFILQPVVENALFYGKGADGRVILQVTAKEALEGWFDLTVRDFGMGMEEETLCRVREGLKEESREGEKEKTGIGLRFVEKMVTFYCGDRAGIFLESAKKEGTAVRIHLPKKKDLGKGNLEEE